MWASASVAVAVILLSVLVAVVAARRLTEPVATLEAAARRVEHGLLSSDPVPTRGPRELATAIQAFNDMAETLAAIERHAVALADDPDDPLLAEPLPGRTGEALQVALDRLRRSVAENEAQRELLAELATHDPLTGLLNRRAACDALARELARVDREGGAVAAVFVDLDGLKGLNDTFGHEVGDAAIVATAGVLRACARETDVVARLGGDEFLVAGPVAPEGGGRVAAGALAERVLAGLAAASVPAGGGSVSLRASIGVAVSGPAGGDAEALVRAADAAMYEAKRAGGDRIAWVPSTPNGPPGEPVEGRGVGEGAAAGGDVGGGAGEDPFDRDLELLAAQRARDGGNDLDAIR